MTKCEEVFPSCKREQGEVINDTEWISQSKENNEAHE